jgi:hypothetical protein
LGYAEDYQKKQIIQCNNSYKSGILEYSMSDYDTKRNYVAVMRDANLECAKIRELQRYASDVNKAREAVSSLIARGRVLGLHDIFVAGWDLSRAFDGLYAAVKIETQRLEDRELARKRGGFQEPIVER